MLDDTGRSEIETVGDDEPRRVDTEEAARPQAARTRESEAETLLTSDELAARVGLKTRQSVHDDLYREKQQRVSLTDDILQLRREHSDVTPVLVGNIRSAFRYRDWLAHGRYWVAKLGRQHDFETMEVSGKPVSDLALSPRSVQPATAGSGPRGLPRRSP